MSFSLLHSKQQQTRAPLSRSYRFFYVQPFPSGFIRDHISSRSFSYYRLLSISLACGLLVTLRIHLYYFVPSLLAPHLSSRLSLSLSLSRRIDYCRHIIMIDLNMAQKIQWNSYILTEIIFFPLFISQAMTQEIVRFFYSELFLARCSMLYAACGYVQCR